MLRRNFFVKSAALTMSVAMLGGVKNSLAQTANTCLPAPTGGINAVEEIKALQIPTGPYAGAYEIAPNGLMSWYFANLGLISIVQYLDAPGLDKYIRAYLDLYISKLEPNVSIRDVHFP